MKKNQNTIPSNSNPLPGPGLDPETKAEVQALLTYNKVDDKDYGPCSCGQASLEYNPNSCSVICPK